MQRTKLFHFVPPCLLLAAGPGLVAVLYFHTRQKTRDERQQTFLTRHFSSIKRAGGRIVMRPTFDFFPLDPPSFTSLTPRALAVGDRFGYTDRHWHGTYQVTGMETDGVMIQYDYEGDVPAYPGHWSGTVHLNWK